VTPVDRITALALAEIERVTRRFADRDPTTWRREMERVVVTAHTAATWTGVAERSRGPLQFAVARLREMTGLMPRQDRERLQQALRDQIGYLRRFAAELDGLSPQAIMARANLYAGAARTTYYTARYGDWDIPDRLLPGNQACVGNCRCTISVRDNGDGTGVLTRVMGGERHCSECPPLAGDHTVFRR
jgi:hypothetical protein